ncbi:hypothetical protein J2M53_14530 [Arthrobacter sp. zg-ZUI100]|uniref:DUF4190 domain-containing protein n=1 Tax=Arthrobacter jiangjiafuii TaxID=2817475 RepID=UPI001AEE5F0A|nr:DUF4190 domain-containing protein [Arthrobacter jiangjiafuii]MBP3037463.1 hypothetical protein [Arthrobacter jiangjiafuii]
MDNTSFSPYAQDHVQPPSPGYPVPQQNPPQDPGTGQRLVISAVVTGAVSILLCWVPIVNSIVFLSAPVGIGLAISALVIWGKRDRRSKALSITGLVLSVLSLVGVLGTQALYSVSVLDIFSSSADRSSGEPDSLPTERKRVASEVLELGSSGKVGEYSVTVTGVDTDATETILAISPFNKAPQGQYVLVDVSATYVGNGEGDPWMDLRIKFTGADARQYDAGDCFERLDQGAHTVPTLETGGAAEFQVCIDIPPEALADAEIFVQEKYSRDGDRVYWSIP